MTGNGIVRPLPTLSKGVVGKYFRKYFRKYFHVKVQAFRTFGSIWEPPDGEAVTVSRLRDEKMNVGQQDSEHRNRQGAVTDDWSALRSDVGGMAEAAVSQGRHFIDSAKDQATEFADKRKADVAQSVADLATSLRDSTSSFEERPNIQAVVDSAAEGLEQLADTIRQKTFADIFEEAENLIRRRPAVFGIAAVAAGFLTARFIKSTSEDMRDEQQRNSSRSRGQRSTPSSI